MHCNLHYTTALSHLNTIPNRNPNLNPNPKLNPNPVRKCISALYNTMQYEWKWMHHLEIWKRC